MAESEHRHSRRVVLGGLGAGVAGLAARRGVTAHSATPEAGAAPAPLGPITATPDDLAAIVDRAVTTYHLQAAMARVVVNGDELITYARGESMNGVPATPEMHFRNGAVAISYIATALLVLVDRGVVTLADSLATWLPDLPEADKVTLNMLANLTAGYTDYVNTPGFTEQNYLNPFRRWTPEELIEVSLQAGRSFAPGENWAYSHTDYVILGLALEKITGQPLAEVLRELVLDPLGLVNTQSWNTPFIPSPVLHAYTSERKATLRIPDDVPFYEESTSWDPSWTLAHGAIQTTNIYDLTASAAGIGEGVLLSPASHAAQMSRELAGFGHEMAGCATCRALSERATYGLGIWLVGDWQLQNPLFAGFGSTMAYLPTRKLAIAAAITSAPAAFDDQGNFLAFNPAQNIVSELAAALAPESPIPV
ncbi:MAG: beta-lactamase family protein [Thermomicrobiales bacterium]|nr:beta-lactamase family protein [Thermomicrobiales bacterium]